MRSTVRYFGNHHSDVLVFARYQFGKRNSDCFGRVELDGLERVETRVLVSMCLVCVLLCARRPCAVAGFIVAVVVAPLKAVRWRRSFAHFGDELLERCEQKTDSTTAVSLPALCLRIFTAMLRVLVGSALWCLRRPSAAMTTTLVPSDELRRWSPFSSWRCLTATAGAQRNSASVQSLSFAGDVERFVVHAVLSVDKRGDGQATSQHIGGVSVVPIDNAQTTVIAALAQDGLELVASAQQRGVRRSQMRVFWRYSLDVFDSHFDGCRHSAFFSFSSSAPVTEDVQGADRKRKIARVRCPRS